MTLDPYEFARTVALSAAAYPPDVRDGLASGTPYQVDLREIETHGLDLLENWQIPQTNTEFYAGKNATGLEIVTRGTTNLPDWKQNLKASLVPWNAFVNPSMDVGAGRVHAGHSECCRSMAPVIRALLDAIPHLPICLRGHSLGGDISTQLGIAIAANNPQRQVTVATIGSPRGGDRQYVEFGLSLHNLTIIRYWHLWDTIVRLPPWLMGYRHFPGTRIPRFGGHLCASYNESANQILGD